MVAINSFIEKPPKKSYCFFRLGNSTEKDLERIIVLMVRGGIETLHWRVKLHQTSDEKVEIVCPWPLKAGPTDPLAPIGT